MAEFQGGSGAEIFYFCEPGPESGLPTQMSGSLGVYAQVVNGEWELRAMLPDGSVRTIQFVEETP